MAAEIALATRNLVVITSVNLSPHGVESLSGNKTVLPQSLGMSESGLIAGGIPKMHVT